MQYYLYRHIRLDKNEPFYIGIGSKLNSYTNFKQEYKRAFSKCNRNNYWKNIVFKTKYEVEILYESDNYEVIKEKEKEFIALYGRINLEGGILCNISGGGGGKVWNIGEVNNRKPIMQIFETGEVLNFKSLNQAVGHTQCSYVMIKQLLNLKRVQYEGYTFKYIK